MAAITTGSGANYTKEAATFAGTSNLSQMLAAADIWNTKLRVVYDTFDIGSDDTAAAAFVLTMGTVPKGARVLGWYVANEANSAAVTADFQLVDPAGNITTASASEAWTSWNSANQQFIPALEAVSKAALDDRHTVTVTTAAATWANDISIVVATLYIIED